MVFRSFVCFFVQKVDTATIPTEREPPSEKLASHSTSKPIDIFGLNGDVLRNIFSYCSVVDLYAMATLNDQLATLILENGIRGRLFDFGKLADCCHILDVFKMFGKQITKIIIGEKDVQYKETTLSKLDEVFRLISTYCSIDTLQYLDLQYFYGTSLKKRYMHAALPFFRAIESFKINETDRNGNHKYGGYLGINPMPNPAINDLVERTIGNASHITSISIFGVKISGRFFYADHVRNLKNLRITHCNLREPDAFITFLKNKPKMKSFIWDSSTLFGMDSVTSHSSNIVFELVTNNVPDLEYFEYNQNEGYINDRNKYKDKCLFLWPNYELLRNFKNLKVLRLLTMELNGLKLLAEMNTVEKLAANLPPAVNEFDLDFLDNFSNLKCIRFHTFESGESCRLKYLSKLPQLTECEISVSYMYPTFDKVIVKAVESAKDLSILRIHSSDRNHYVKFDLYSKLLEARLAHGFSAKPLVLYLNKTFVKKGFVSRLGEGYRPDVIEIRQYDSFNSFFSF